MPPLKLLLTYQLDTELVCQTLIWWHGWQMGIKVASQITIQQATILHPHFLKMRTLQRLAIPAQPM